MPHHTEAAVVREIIRLSHRGTAPSEIVTILNGQGAKRRNGTARTARQVRAIVSRRELYERGKIHYGSVNGESERLILIRINDA
jgi:hypothetical protein